VYRWSVKEVRCHAVRDMVVSWPLWLVAVSLLVTHTSLTFLLDVPHCPRYSNTLSLSLFTAARRHCLQQHAVIVDHRDCDMLKRSWYLL